MSQTKPSSAPAPKDLAALLRLLGDATRLRIFLLLRGGETCVCEVATALDLAENLVSHHLGILRRAGLIEARRDPTDARWVYYHLNAEALEQLAKELGCLFDSKTLGTRTPTCGPAALLMPVRATSQPAITPESTP